MCRRSAAHSRCAVHRQLELNGLVGGPDSGQVDHAAFGDGEMRNHVVVGTSVGRMLGTLDTAVVSSRNG